MTQKPIKRAALAATLLLALAALTGCPQRAPLALKKVVLYQNGIGYFERQGTFTGDKIRLHLRSHELNDVLKSLTVIDRTAGDKPRPVTAVVPKQEPATPSKDGTVAPAAAADKPIYLDITLGHAGRHDLLIAYSVPTPTWKATYRLVLPDDEAVKDQALIQGWALINNASGEDWSKVRLTLATGAPMTFAMDMRTPQFIARPDLTGKLVKPVTTGVVTSESARPGDQDGDGVGDAVDLCPGEPEDRDGFEDKDGCPDADNDKDRILDADDRCPNEPEVYNGFSDDDGCPDKGRVVVHKGRIEILDKIYFATGSAAIKQVSMPILNAIVATLMGNPQIKIIEVQGHAASAERDTWALSAQRAGAVRAALMGKGVRTEVRARAYGATRKTDSRETKDAHARNQRVEFLIIKRIDGSDAESGNRPAAPGPVTAEAARKSVHRGAKLATVAGMVRYELPGAVSIGQGTTTMVTMINRPTSAQDVYLYRPDSNVPGSDLYPQRAAMIQNSSKLTLEPGPVAIFARGTFVGEGLIKRLHPGQTAFIPYAVDSSASVRVDSTTGEKPSTFVSLIDGVATVENHAEIVTRYEVETGGQTPKMIVVKHPRRTGYEQLDLPPGTSTTPTALLIPFPINPTSKSVLTVRERKPVRRTIWIKSGGEGTAARLELYLSASTALSAEGQQKLRQIIAAQRKVASLTSTVDRLRGRISDIGMRSGELRESIKAVARTRGGAALRARLLKQLTVSVSQLGQATQKLTAGSLELSEARDALKKLIASLRIPAVQPDQKKEKKEK